ncbi:tyrosine-protein kinase Etk/Wzc [Dyella sp. OK004]|uniref:polysaccharide biosynthesis tyrosine autokinase n=1 Tax=Dyella sp. OK004 TaxID=1855292 RepID=UPI0008E51D50|nr:polysaccharide biosynthesis tyrosine autokinase [Dyella sp. OK004]SFR99866.1 tyrosine-protein kinase Etk/Wzc [Dyella sp. OK004]
MSEHDHREIRDNAHHKELDLLALVDMIFIQYKLILASVIALLVLGVGYAFLARPVYRTDLLVQVNRPADRAGQGLLGELSSILDVPSSGDAEIEVIRSRLVLKEAIEHSHFDIEVAPIRFPLIGDLLSRHQETIFRPGLFGLGGYNWGNELATVDRFDVPHDLEGEKFTLTALDADRFRLTTHLLSQAMVGQIGRPVRFPSSMGDIVIKVSGFHALPGASFQLRKWFWLDVIEDLRKRMVIAELGKQSGVISVALNNTDPARVSRLFNQVGDVYVRQNRDQKSEEARKSLGYLERQLPELKSTLSDSEEALLRFRNKHKAIDLSEEARLALGQAVALQTRISLLQQERLALLQQFTPSHPNVVVIDRQMGAAGRELGDIELRTSALPSVEQEFVRLTRDVRVNSDLYVALSNSMQQLRLAQESAIANVRIVDRAAVQETPIAPRRLLITAASLLGGLMFGLCVVLVRRLLFGGITQPHDIEDALGKPVYAAIPVSKHQRRNERLHGGLRKNQETEWPVLASLYPQDPVVESLRSLRMALQLALLDAGGNVVVITGPTKGIGKSFVSINLAGIFSTSGKRVLLIDGDLRKGRLDRRFGLGNALGLASVLAGNVAVTEAIQATSTPMLDVLTTGPKPARPTEFLQSANLRALLGEVSKIYDLVVIDGTPTLPVVDVIPLAAAASLVVLVARYDVTHEGELMEACRRLERAGGRVGGVLLNAMQSSAVSSRYGYGNYDSYAVDNPAS